MLKGSTTDGSDVMKLLFNSLRRSVYTSVVVRVESYDPATSTADVTPMVSEERKIDGEYVTIPAITQGGCPVIFMGGAGNSLITGLQAGDYCMGLFRHRSHDEIDNGDIGPLKPESSRRMDLCDLIVFGNFVAPANGLEASQYRSDNQPVLAMPEVSALHVGDSGAAYYLVREDTLTNYLNLLKGWIEAHTHDGGILGGGLTGPPKSIPPLPLPAIPDLKSTRIKVDS